MFDEVLSTDNTKNDYKTRRQCAILQASNDLLHANNDVFNSNVMLDSGNLILDNDFLQVSQRIRM